MLVAMRNLNMGKRALLKRVIIALSTFLCVEIGFFIYQINFGTIGYVRNLDLGNKYLLSEDYESAISAFSKAIEIDGMNAEAYIGRGDAYKANGDYVSAWSDYEKAEEISGDTTILSEKIGPTEIAIVSGNGDGIDGAVVQLEGDSHTYELTTDNSGHISTVLFPEKYDVQITKEKYSAVQTELSVEKGGVIIDPIQLAVDGQLMNMGLETDAELATYAESMSYLYGMSCQFDYRKGEMSVEDLDTNKLLGYRIDDYDEDGRLELLVVGLDPDYSIRFDIYENENGEVVLTDTTNIEIDSVYGKVTLPFGKQNSDTTCGLLSCFVRKEGHKIYVQSSYATDIFVDGKTTLIAALEYRNKEFSDYQLCYDDGSSIENSFEKHNEELVTMGVPEPNFDNIFNKMEPLYIFFTDDIYEICHVEQYSMSSRKDYANGGRVLEVYVQNDFADSDELFDSAVSEEKRKAKSALKELYADTIWQYDEIARAALVNSGREDDQERCTYYTLADIDDNGVDELILRYEYPREVALMTSGDSGYGESVAIYTIKDGDVIKVLSNGERMVVSTFVHDGFVRIYKGDNLINKGFAREPMDAAFYKYENGVLADEPVLKLCISFDSTGDFWMVNDERTTQEECFSKYDEATNGGYGYRMFRYDKSEFAS